MKTTEVVKKSGAFYSFGDLRLGQGRENSKAFLRENPEIAAQIETLVRAKLAPPPLVDEQDNNEQDDDQHDPLNDTVELTVATTNESS